jgi:hypothetical protein
VGVAHRVSLLISLSVFKLCCFALSTRVRNYDYVIVITNTRTRSFALLFFAGAGWSAGQRIGNDPYKKSHFIPLYAIILNSRSE